MVILSVPTKILKRLIIVGTINKIPSSIIFRSKNDVLLKISFSSIKKDDPKKNKNITIYLKIILKAALSFDIAMPSPLCPMKMFMTLLPGVACQDDATHNTSNIIVNIIGMNIVNIKKNISKNERADKGESG